MRHKRDPAAAKVSALEQAGVPLAPAELFFLYLLAGGVGKLIARAVRATADTER